MMSANKSYLQAIILYFISNQRQTPKYPKCDHQMKMQLAYKQHQTLDLRQTRIMKPILTLKTNRGPSNYLIQPRQPDQY